MERCRSHFMGNLLTKVPKSTQPFVVTLMRSIFAQLDAESVRDRYRRVVESLEPKVREAANMLDERREELLAFTREHWRQVWSNNPRSDWTANCADAPTSSASPTNRESCLR